MINIINSKNIVTNLDPESMQIPTVQYCPNLGSDATVRPFDSFVT